MKQAHRNEVYSVQTSLELAKGKLGGLVIVLNEVLDDLNEKEEINEEKVEAVETEIAYLEAAMEGIDDAIAYLNDCQA